MPSVLKLEIQQPAELYDAIVDYYQAQIAAGDSKDVAVVGYQDFVASTAGDREVRVEVGEAEGGPLQPDGRVAQIYRCVLYAVISKAQPDAALQAMNLASALARHLPHNSWGFSAKAVEDPKKIKLSESFLINEGEQHAGFEAWEVSWHQQINLGSPQFEDDPVVSGIWLAVNPADPDDIGEYSEVAECLSSSITEQIS